MERKESSREWFVLLGGVMVGALLLAACGPGPRVSNPDKRKASLGSNIVMANAALNHSPGGTADLAWDADSQKLVVRLQVIGLEPKSVHPTGVRVGSCRQPGAVKYGLANLVANVSGVANTTNTLEHVKSGLAQANWSIVVYAGASAQPGQQNLIISCADVQNGSGKVHAGQNSQVMHIVIGAASGPNQKASGVAQLRWVDKSLSVNVTMTGLVPRSVHMAYIHTGSCEAQGGVAYALKPISADSQGNGSSITVLNGIDHVPGRGWYINVRLAGDVSTQLRNEPIVCGNVQTAG